MGKGGGCVPSKKKLPPVASTNAPRRRTDDASPISVSDRATDLVTESNSTASPSLPQQIATTLRIFIVFYSMYGHVESLARRMKKGVDGIDGVEGILFRVPETLSIEVLEKMLAPPKGDEISVISAAELAAADGILFGFPTRYGSMAAQMKAFFDSTGQLWKDRALAGKPAGFFVSTGTQGGGQESTAWTAITQLVHHGMLFVPIGYTFGSGMFRMHSIRGGSPYGAGVFAGDGTRKATETELSLAEHQGRYMAAVVKRLAQPVSW